MKLLDINKNKSITEPVEFTKEITKIVEQIPGEGGIIESVSTIIIMESGSIGFLSTRKEFVQGLWDLTITKDAMIHGDLINANLIR